MKTETLIETLSADLSPARRFEGFLPWAFVAATLAAGAVFLLIAGVRPDLAVALGHANVLVKQAAPVLLAVGGLGLLLRLGRPGADIGSWPWVPVAGAAAVLAAMAVQLAILPVPDWAGAVRGHSRGLCLTMIPVIALPILASVLVALRRAAPIRPGLCGAVAGLMSGAAAASVYAFFCREDNPLFFGTWYGVAMLIVVLAGFLFGRRALRW